MAFDTYAVYMESRFGSSRKFYAVFIHQRDYRAMVVWGRIGSRGQAQSVSTHDARKRIMSKQKKGYSTVWSGQITTNGWDQYALLGALSACRRNPTVRSREEVRVPHEQEAIFAW